METRKILHIIYAKEWGGGESCAYLMSREAAKNGADVFIVLDQRLAAFENRFSEFATVSCMNLKRNPLLLNAVKVGRLLEREKINIIHIHTGKVLPLAVFYLIVLVGSPLFPIILRGIFAEILYCHFSAAEEIGIYYSLANLLSSE